MELVNLIVRLELLQKKMVLALLTLKNVSAVDLAQLHVQQKQLLKNSLLFINNGTGLSFYLKYAEDSTEDDPKVLARGVDENGNEFEQTISVKDVNPHNATVVEMHALEAVSGAPKRNGLTSLPMGSENVGLNYKQDFIEAFKKNIADMNMLGEYGIAQEYNKLLSFYEKFSGK